MHDEWKDLIGGLAERELYVVACRFGLGDIEQMTLEQVGSTMGVTRERIRQIEAKALRKLRVRARVIGVNLTDYL